MVYVLSINKEPLMPCSDAISRILLKQGKAKVVRRDPFTIKLLYETTTYIQKITLGVDTGSSALGVAATDEKGRVLYVSEVTVRNDITEKMKQRSKYRRNRRSRKTRYRKARFDNRKNSIKQDRISPTVKSKIESHKKEINFAQQILPISTVIIEVANFDVHALKNPEVLMKAELYQKGTNYGFANTKAYVLYRDGYTCQICNNKNKDKKLEVHHIIYRSNMGSDDEANLIILCNTCHEQVHKGILTLKKQGKRKGNLNHATQMNVVKTRLTQEIECEITYGYKTKEDRQALDLPKEHYMDAAVIASRGKEVNFKQNKVLVKKCIPKGDYKQTKGVRSEQRIPTGKIQGFRKYDKVKYMEKEYFIKGRMNTGYAILMDIEGKKVDLKPIPKFEKMERIGARKTWIISEKDVVNIC